MRGLPRDGGRVVEVPSHTSGKARCSVAVVIGTACPARDGAARGVVGRDQHPEGSECLAILGDACCPLSNVVENAEEVVSSEQTRVGQNHVLGSPQKLERSDSARAGVPR